MAFFKNKKKEKIIKKEEGENDDGDVVSEVSDDDGQDIDEKDFLKVPKPSYKDDGLNKEVKAAIAGYQAKYGGIYDLNVLLQLNPIMIKKEELTLLFAVYNELKKLNENIESMKE